MNRTERIAFNRAHIAAVRLFLARSRRRLYGKIRPQTKVRLTRGGSEMNWDTDSVPELGSEVTVRGEQWTVAATVRTAPGEVRTMARGTGLFLHQRRPLPEELPVPAAGLADDMPFP